MSPWKIEKTPPNAIKPCNTYVQMLAPAGALTAIWTSPAYSHCMFTAREGFDAGLRERFAAALYAMDWEKPAHRAVLEAEGLRSWLPPDTDGHDSLRAACERRGLLL